jgi:hypothetical protein
MTTTRELVTFEYQLDGVVQRTEQKMRNVYRRKDGTARIEVLGGRRLVEDRGGELVYVSNTRTVPASRLGPLEMLEARHLATRNYSKQTWRDVAVALLEHLELAMEVPADLGELAPSGLGDEREAAAREALVSLKRSR